MKTIQYLLICLLFAGPASGQTARIKRADDHYDNLAYAQASEEYRHVVDKTNDPHSLRRLAECYTRLNRTAEAENCYRQLIESGSFLPADLLACSRVMRSNDHPEDAQRYLAQYCSLVPEDQFARYYLEGTQQLSQQEQQSERFDLHALAVNGPYSDFGAAWFGNRLLFVSSRTVSGIARRTSAWNEEPYMDVFIGTPDPAFHLGGIELFPGKINTKFHEGPLTVHPNGRIIYFTRNNYLHHHSGTSENKTQRLKIYKAFLVDGTFSEISDLPFNNDEYSTGHPSISADGKWLFFASDMPGGFGGTDIYKVALDEHGSIAGQPVNLGALVNTSSNELFPFVHDSGMLFFSSAGWPGYGGLDIFVCETDRSGTLNRRSNVGKPANSEQDDFSFILNKEQTEGYLSSNRQDGAGNDDIWHFNLLRPFGHRFQVNGFVTDNRSHEILPFTVIQLLQHDSIVASMQADSAGHYAFEVEPGMDYRIAGEQEHYFHNEVAFSAVFEDDVYSLQQDLGLARDPNLFLYGVVTDAATGELLKDVTITLTDKKTNTTTVYSTTTGGDFRQTLEDRLLNDRIDFFVQLEKDGYLGKSFPFSRIIEKEGEIRVSEDLRMEKITLGADLGKIIDLAPIYFDYARFTIRKDAATELDKIVQVLNDNPDMVVELGAHTDARGAAKANQSLSQKRAQASADYIRKRITRPERITAKGYGESMLLNNCADGVTCSETEHQLNRRTEFRVVKM